jgi:hypothetical protein
MGSINARLIEELVEDCQKQKYCLFKELVKASGRNPEDYINEEFHIERGLIFERSKAIEELIEEYCPEKEVNCEYRASILKSGMDIKSLKQFKCLEIYKYLESKRKGTDLGWQNAFIDWVEKGFAEKFNDLYDKKDEKGKERPTRKLYITITGDKE